LYSLLNAAVSSAGVYVVWLDGVGFRHFGTHGLLSMDAALNFLVFGIVAAVFISRGFSLRVLRRHRSKGRDHDNCAEAL
jgi:hypothetical protein